MTHKTTAGICTRTQTYPAASQPIRINTSAQSNTHVLRQLILQELQIERQIGLGHLHRRRPARQLGQHARRHVHDEAVVAVQQIQERAPDVLLARQRKLVEDLDAMAVLLQQIVDQHQNVLDGRVLGHVRQQVEQRARRLVGILLQIRRLGVAVDGHNRFVVLGRDHLRLFVRLPVDGRRADVAGLLLQHTGGRDHVCGHGGGGGHGGQLIDWTD